jgi:hypothetical protein
MPKDLPRASTDVHGCFGKEVRLVVEEPVEPDYILPHVAATAPAPDPAAQSTFSAQLLG